MRRFLAFWFAALVLLWVLPLPAHAAGGCTASLDRSSGSPGSYVQLSIRYNGAQGVLGALELHIGFDGDAFEFSGLSRSAYLPEVYQAQRLDAAGLRVIYVAKSGAGLGSGELASCRLRVRENAPVGSSDIRFQVVSALTADAQELPELSGGEQNLPCQVEPPPSSDAYLTALTPPAGQLEPAFDSSITQYYLRVPSSVAVLDFAAVACPGARCQVNRRNLGAAGTSTDFLFTVTAADQTTKTVYRVTVEREPRPTPSPKPTATPKPTASPKPTATPKPTASPKPTATPKPTASPKPTATPKPTASPKPTATPKPTASPKPSKTPKPTASPKPTATPKPSASPKPSKTPKPTASPKPSKTPKPTASPKPSKTPKPTASPKPSSSPLPVLPVEPPSSGPGGSSGLFSPGGASQGTDPFLLALLLVQLTFVTGLLVFLTARHIRMLEKALREAQKKPPAPSRPTRRRRSRASRRRTLVRVKIKKKP